MKTRLYESSLKHLAGRSMAALLFCALLAFSELAASAQEPTPTPMPASTPTSELAPAATPETPKIPNDQLDSLVAPIALYPDPLLSQVLVASTYPLELAQLQQWLEKSGSFMNEKAVTEAVQKEAWDPSVQAMATLPTVVRKLVENITWTTDLGNAFLAQQSDVMQAVQRMRVKAKDAGKLKSSEQIKVETTQVENQSYVVIEQARPEVVYVPTYDPVWMWGFMPYPYPPWYGGYYVGAGMWYGSGIAIGVGWVGGWGYGAGWGYNNININRNNNFVNHYNNRNPNRGDRVNPLNSGNNAWRHNPQHRGGAPYANRDIANRFGGQAGNRDLSGLRGGGRDLGSRPSLGGGGRPQAGNLNLSALNRPATSNIGANRGSMGGDRIGSRDISRGMGQRNMGSFGGSGSFGGGAARASSMRGSSSMRSGGYGGRSFGGGGGMRGGGGRGGGGRR